MADSQGPNSRCNRAASVANFLVALGLATTGVSWQWTKSRPGLLEVTLIGALLLCLVLAFAAQRVVMAARYSQNLTREVTRRNKAEEELTWAREQLAIQVRRRAESQRINTLLLNEVEEHRRAEDCLRQLNSCLLRLQEDEARCSVQESQYETRPMLVNLGFDIGNLGATSDDATNLNRSTKEYVS